MLVAFIFGYVMGIMFGFIICFMLLERAQNDRINRKER